MCGSCPATTDLRTFTVDGQPYDSSNAPNQTCMYQVQRDSGYTYGKTKYSTVNMQLGGSFTGVVSTMNPTPFPDLDAIYGMRLPFYDMSDVMTADETTYCGLLDFIAINESMVKSQTVWQGVLAAACFVAGTVLIVYVCLGKGEKKSRNERLKEHTRNIDHDD